ncbi:T9SS type A sorting domain-containing protein [Psychroserpens ponticola]|uniref:T9SS type A sorting domain-containing protein n=1 Tax=Psychroserpens ponticola TaxID=2932268 RepID=A0ABY7S3E6_9FLAO|nr:T9SS type A sorting domain-containing protein [Psychroserpens ponticola]WCO03497.1 T9SS type A sorting domain-containing protein [Psychroserpens ponticola]
MKTKLHFLVLCLILGLLPILNFSQCPTSNITLSSQAEVDAFSTNYPDCTMLTDRLTISGADITDLTALSTITYIPNLRILDNPLLTELDGLHNLQSLISNNTALQLEDNPLLTNLTVFTGLTSLSHLHIQGCSSLVNLEGLNFVTDFDPNGIGGGGFTGLKIDDNISLTDISALTNISNANIDIGLYAFFIIISNNPVLGSLNGLQAFDGVYDFLQIINNDSLINLTGLSDNFGVSDQDFVISNNDLLQSLGDIGGGGISQLVIDNNPLLDDISAFNNFSTTFGPFLKITNNPNLSICENNLFCASINRLQEPDFIDLYPLFIIENNAESCSSVGEVAFACGFVPFNDECDNAFSLTIGQQLQAYDDLSTTSIQIPSCNDVNRLDVWFKVNSESFNNLDIIAESSYNLQLWEGDCSNLTQVINACAENALLDIPVTTNTDYYIQVWSDSETDRATGLFDILVQNATLTIEDFTFKDFTLYPNPTSNILNLKSNKKMDFVRVYNLLGQQISSSKPNSLVEEINMSELNSGMYLISVEIDGNSVVYRVMKE